MSKVRAEQFTNKAGNNGPDFPFGLSGIGIHSGGTVIHSGIITALNFAGTDNTIAVNGTTVDINIPGSSDNISAVDGTFTGNVSVGGTLTYEDVTNIDSVGIVTARGGFDIGISSSGTLINNGPIKALNFVGTGNTFSVDGTTINISISGGGGGFSQLDTWLFAP